MSNLVNKVRMVLTQEANVGLKLNKLLPHKYKSSTNLKVVCLLLLPVRSLVLYGTNTGG